MKQNKKVQSDGHNKMCKKREYSFTFLISKIKTKRV